MSAITLLQKMQQSPLGNKEVLAILYSSISKIPAFKNEAEILLKAFDGTEQSILNAIVKFQEKSEQISTVIYEAQIDIAVTLAALHFVKNDAANCKQSLSQAKQQCDAWISAIEQNPDYEWRESGAATILGLSGMIATMFGVTNALYGAGLAGLAFGAWFLVPGAVICVPLLVINAANNVKAQKELKSKNSSLLSFVKEVRNLVQQVDEKI
jgi:hypothetical protein